MSVTGDDVLRDAQNFSLVLGGPLYQVLRRAHLADDALLLVRQRVVAIALFAWLPLFLLCALQGNLLGEAVAVPFLLDVEVHVRFLGALPLLVVAELVVHQRMRPIARTFLERKLIPEADLARFDDAINSALRLRNSVPAELVLIGLVYALGVLVVWRHYIALDTATWYAMPEEEGTRLTLAGIWYGFVSLPVFQFLLARWYFRLFIWTRFLWRVSRIELQLVPTHPDRVGGLGFLANTVYAFAVLALAHGALLAGTLANRIFFLDAALPEFTLHVAAMLLFLFCIVFGPLLVFTPRLAQEKRTGLREYGTLAERYVRQFDAKWVRGGGRRSSGETEPLLGSADLQSLADLANAYEVVRGMRLAPITRDAVVQLAGAALLPLAPLVLTMMPLEQLLRQLFGILF
jgi:hypothetical protein